MSNRYVIGIDFGTLSARALLVDIDSGTEIAESVKDYNHGVMDSSLPDGTSLDHNWALQDPRDYLDCLQYTVKDILKRTGIKYRKAISY